MRIWKLALSPSAQVRRTAMPPPGRVITIGNFDGVHRGHQTVLAALVKSAQDRSLRSAVLSFYPHPSVALGRLAHVRYLTPLRQKLSLLTENGVDELILVHFDEQIRNQSAEEFISKILIKELNVEHLLLGYDTRIGKNRGGDATQIIEILAGYHKSAQIVERVDIGGEIVSSRRIRAEIDAGNIGEVQQLLGRPYSLSGRVVHGNGRGNQIGFPTANLHWGLELLPPFGVYAGFATFDGKTLLPAVANIGVRPTFAGTGSRVEVHILDFNKRIYGKRLSFQLLKQLRPEKKFNSVEELKNQIALDCQNARSVLSSAVEKS